MHTEQQDLAFSSELLRVLLQLPVYGLRSFLLFSVRISTTTASFFAAACTHAGLELMAQCPGNAANAAQDDKL